MGKEYTIQRQRATHANQLVRTDTVQKGSIMTRQQKELTKVTRATTDREVNARVVISRDAQGKNETTQENGEKRSIEPRQQQKKKRWEREREGTRHLHHHREPTTIAATADSDRCAGQIRLESGHALHFIAIPHSGVSIHSNPSSQDARHLVTARLR